MRESKMVYAITVSDPIKDEYFTAYTTNDLDEAEGHRQFLEATCKGAKIRIERYEWEENR